MRSWLLPLLLLSACGGGGSGVEAPAGGSTEAPSIVWISEPLFAAGGWPLQIETTGLPGPVSTLVTVRLTASEGTPFENCTSAVIEQRAIQSSPTRIAGILPTQSLVGDVRAFVTILYPGGPNIESDGPIARIVGRIDAALDQDLDGVADGCDPRTYDFELESIGSRPLDTTPIDVVDDGLEVATSGGDRVVRFGDAHASGRHDRFDRLRADYPQQETTAYIDFDDTASVAAIEFWSDGSWAGLSGSGLLLYVRADGRLVLYRRIWRSLALLSGPLLPESGRVRVRVLKGEGSNSSFHLDLFEGGVWQNDRAVMAIEDDTRYRGRDTALAEYSGGTRGIKRLTVVHAVPETPLTLARSAEGATDWKVFQRDADDQATIPLSFLYRLEGAGRAEARVVERRTGSELPGHGFDDHRLPLPAAAGARGTLDLEAVPAGGNYDVELRLVDPASGAVLGEAKLEQVAVGDVYLAIGQSNMSGISHSLAGATPPIPEAHLFHNDGAWQQASEPMDASTNQVDAVSRDAPQHSLMLPFARSLYEATQVPVGIIPASLGGTNLHTQWQRHAPLPENRLTLYGSALHRARLQGGQPALAGLLWFQGESDAIAERSVAAYRADLEGLIAGYRGDLTMPDLPLFCVQLGTWSGGGFPWWTGIQEAQRQVARSDPRVTLTTCVDLPRSDGIHYSVASYQEIGRRLANQARVLLFDEDLDPLTELLQVAANETGTTITLTYDADVTGGEPALFHILDENGEVPVTSVEANGSQVTLQLGRGLGALATLSYGTSIDPAAGWIEDAAGVAVPCFANLPVGP